MNTTERMAAEVRNDMKRSYQRYFLGRLANVLLDHARVYPLSPGEMPDHEVVFTGGIELALLEMFHREPDILASFLPENFAVVDRDHMRRIMDTMWNAIPIYSPVPFSVRPDGKVAPVGDRGLLGPINGSDMADLVIRYSAERLYGISEMARRKHEEDEDRAETLRNISEADQA